MSNYFIFNAATVIGFLAVAATLIKFFVINKIIALIKMWFNSIFYCVNEATFIIGKKNNLIYSNELALNMIGIEMNNDFEKNKELCTIKCFYTEKEMSLLELVNKRVKISFKGYINADVSEGAKHIFVGTIVPLFFSKRNFFGTAVVIRDVTLEMKSQEIIYNMSNYDTLTGVPNKNYFDDYLNLAIQNSKLENRMVGLLIIDLDKFKTVNDIMGHKTGDILLKNVADTIKAQLSHGTQIARIGEMNLQLFFLQLKKLKN